MSYEIFLQSVITFLLITLLFLERLIFVVDCRDFYFNSRFFDECTINFSLTEKHYAIILIHYPLVISCTMYTRY